MLASKTVTMTIIVTAEIVTRTTRRARLMADALTFVVHPDSSRNEGLPIGPVLPNYCRQVIVQNVA